MQFRMVSGCRSHNKENSEDKRESHPLVRPPVFVRDIFQCSILRHASARMSEATASLTPSASRPTRSCRPPRYRVQDQRFERYMGKGASALAESPSLLIAPVRRQMTPHRPREGENFSKTFISGYPFLQ